MGASDESSEFCYYDEDNKKSYGEAIEKGYAEYNPTVVDPRDEGHPDGWIKRNQELIRLTGNRPFNSHPPLTLLMKQGFITPVPLHYVRNHSDVPKAQKKTVKVCGLVERETEFTMDQLVNEFSTREFVVTLACSGNRRKEQNMVKRTKGFNWGAAVTSTTLWRGTPLSALLEYCGIKENARHVCFEGSDGYGTSIKIEFAMDPSREIIVAYMQNAKPLTPDHGFPFRIIVPGFIGGRMVKWLERIEVTEKESDNDYHYYDNRVLPSFVDAALAEKEDWWHKPEYIINELNINSVITTPCHDENLLINASTNQYTLKGYAYSGGGRKVTRVEITMDGGATWQLCELDHQEKPNKYGKSWCWCFWNVDVEVNDLLGAQWIAVRAWDESHNTQPEKLIWNVLGLMNNCWFRVKINVYKPSDGEITINFDHPIQPGDQPGGWMTGEEDSGTSPQPPSNTYTIEEVKEHNSRESLWIIINGHVYDITDFRVQHPGGEQVLLIKIGEDRAEDFKGHSDYAKNLVEKYRIGDLETTEESASTTP